ncbi:MAG TPA: RNA-guided endonuclease IscB [Ktedonobacterales bacterium]|nr:RNA-guided endonuclease IscB [Ktedonobacterales bacterium]
MAFVFVVDTERRPLVPCHPARARRLLTEGKAAVWRRYPFTIILKRAVPEARPAPPRVKIDPGSKVTGLALVSDATAWVVWATEVTHRGHQVKARLDQRRACCRSRRQRHTRYRPARFANRHRRAGRLPPSLESRISNVLTWVARLRSSAAVSAQSLGWCPISLHATVACSNAMTAMPMDTRRRKERRRFPSPVDHWLKPGVPAP